MKGHSASVEPAAVVESENEGTVGDVYSVCLCIIVPAVLVP